MFHITGSINIKDENKTVSYSIFVFWASPDEDYSRNVSCALHFDIYVFIFIFIIIKDF